jgi:hypothetical protein
LGLFRCRTASPSGRGCQPCPSSILGPAIAGPTVGDFTIENTSWLWMFYGTSIVGGITQVADVFLLQETFDPSLLQTKSRKLRRITGNSAYHTKFDKEEVGIKLRSALVWPCRLLLTQPIVQVLALYSAYVYGLTYLTLSTFPDLWSEADHYHEPIGLGSLSYLSFSLVLGFALASELPARVNARVYLSFAKRPGLQVYIVDAYTRYAASTMAAIYLLRSVTGMWFLLFALHMFRRLNYGWGNSLLVFISIVIGFPRPALLWYYGAAWKRSPFAAGA